MVVQKKQRKPGEASWPKVVLKKWLNLKSKDSEFNADEEDDDEGSDVDEQENCGCDGDGDGGEAPRRTDGDIADENVDGGAPYKLRRRNSETLRAQYIKTKELKLCVGTWNAAGKVPPGDLDIAEWLGAGAGDEPADVYVLGFQEVVPLNAGNVFGAEDGRPAQAWEELIRGALRRAQPPARPRYKCYSHPPSPSRGDGTATAAATTDDELFPGADTDTDTNTDDDSLFSSPAESEQQNVAAVTGATTPRRLTRLNHFTAAAAAMDDSGDDSDEQQQQQSAQQRTLLKTLSRSDRVGLAWPEQPLDLLAKHATATASTTMSSSSASFKSSRSFRTYKSFKPSRVAAADDDNLDMIADLDLDLATAAAAAARKRRSPYVRIVSKQMVGIFLTVWVRRGLRRCVHNVRVSTVGVGAMGYIGNKGSVSVSMSVYQTMFCFVCTHLAAGEKAGDLHKRNADVQEIHRRTHFAGVGDVGAMPRDIYDHERIFWLGDLNYRIDVAYERAHELISTMDWTQLAEKDQLKRELRKGRAFDGWTEGVLEFAPTYKYELNSAKCDRILSFGKGVKLMSYGRVELTMSDHRPVVATYAAEVEVFSSRKLQRALTLTDAEVEAGTVVAVPDHLAGF
uniref:Inositol polyphosphate-related phosphatase domain-containing protein n=1 Tax=Oryza punctata TaxID=4537 RepID=A0A0E0JEY5_ORYPU